MSRKNELLYRNAAECIAEHYIKNIYESTGKVAFSERHKARMEEIFGHKSIMTVFFRIPKRITFVFLICALIIATPLSIKAIREPLFDFFASLFSNEVHLRIDGTTVIEQCPKSIKGEYVLDYVPEGYELENRDATETRVTLRYSDGAGSFEFVQSVLETYDLIIPGNSQILDDEIIINGFEGKAYTYDGITVLVWANDEYLFEIISGGTLDLEELIKTAEGVSGGLYTDELDQMNNAPVSVIDEEPDDTGTCVIERGSFDFTVPNGLTEMDNMLLEGMLIITFQDKNGGSLILQISDRNKQIAMFNIDESYIKKQITEDIVVYEKLDFPCAYVWQDDRYYYLINCYSEAVTPDMVEDMIKSLY